MGRNLVDKFLYKMGKLNNRYLSDTYGVKGSRTEFSKRKVESSAMGEVTLQYFNIPGSVNIDMMKTIQREKNLESYKLDSVSAIFIKEDIIKIEFENEDLKIYTKNTKALDEKAYIQIMVNDGYSPGPLFRESKFLDSLTP